MTFLVDDGNRDLVEPGDEIISVNPIRFDHAHGESALEQTLRRARLLDEAFNPDAGDSLIELLAHFYELGMHHRDTPP